MTSDQESTEHKDFFQFDDCTRSVSTLHPLNVLLTEIIDYAGLFPPSELGMSQAVRNYARYLGSEHAWMLGRFVVPATRLMEFARAAQDFLPCDPTARPWRLSVLLGSDIEREVESVLRFNELHREPVNTGTAVVDAIELKISHAEDVRRATETIASLTEVTAFDIYFETPLADNLSELIHVIAQVGARAKVRTGGVTAEVIPSTSSLLSFIAACARANVPFKATAGLHHPLRAVHPLTYEQDSPSATMHGFLNVFLAAAFLRNGMNMDQAARLLEEHDAQNIRFGADGVAWRDHRLSVDQLREARAKLACSFGSCSFEEPIQELQMINLL
ncbi:MAG: hypothetical protein H0T92_14055 [Pyrinomonadaceae bacterium]|nr:hypothetical protein [Pyrinomonadaceae bacterium]